MQEFHLKPDQEFIPLIQLLKAAGVAFSGSEAQQMVVDGIVKVNGKREQRKRAKIRSGFTVEVEESQIKVV
jgi:ribosome-associated protein